MRYSANHKLETKEKLLQSSALSAKRSGFSTVGVDGLMKAIGLSGGAFYSHFSSKDELFASIVERELGHSLARLGGEQDRERLERCLKHYLTHGPCRASGIRLCVAGIGGRNCPFRRYDSSAGGALDLSASGELGAYSGKRQPGMGNSVAVHRCVGCGAYAGYARDSAHRTEVQLR